MTTITIDRAVVEQALEAMQIAAAELDSPYTSTTPEERVLRAAITALRAALAQEQAEPFTPDAIHATQAAWKMGYEARKAEEAEPAQEPVGAVLVNRESREGVMFYSADMVPDPTTLKDRFELVKVCTCRPAPPQRKPLTEEEIERIRADEREACATRLEAIGCDHCAANIRARGKEC